MSSFFFQRDEVHCSCFNNSPKNALRIFRTDSQFSSKSQNKESLLQSARNPSQQSKHKKKSLKKERHHSYVGSQKDAKQKEEPHQNVFIPDVPTSFSGIQTKKEQKLTVLDYFQPSFSGNVKTERTRPSHIIRNQRPQPLYQPINFEANCKNSQTSSQKIPFQIQPDKNVIDSTEYERKVTQEFEKDFMEFKLQMEMIESHGQKVRTNRQKICHKPSVDKFCAEALQKNTNENLIRYPATEQNIFLGQKQKTPMRAASFRNSPASNREKLSIKRPKDKMLPKQIESEKGSSSPNSSSRESVFLGRGLDGLTEKQASFEENENLTGKKDRFNLETMITQESHIKNSQINTTEESHCLTSPKSHYNLGLAFGGGNKYGAAGMSYQEIGDLKGRKIASSTKFHL